jgi:hypothetical protein
MNRVWAMKILGSLLAAVVGMVATASPATAGPVTGDYVATFQVAGSETYKLRLSD